MSKQKQLTKNIARTGIIAAVLVAVATGAYVGVSMATESVEKQKQDTESQFNSDQEKLRGLKEQYDKSGVAEKSFVEIQSKRAQGAAYTSSVEQLIDYLRAAKPRYKFFKFDTTRPPKETPTDKTELANFNNQLIVTRPLKFNITAISDTHVFSFIDELRNSMPGFVRIDSIMLKRTGDMVDSTFNNLTNGVMSPQVEARIEITWITVASKDVNAAQVSAPQGGSPTP